MASRASHHDDLPLVAHLFAPVEFSLELTSTAVGAVGGIDNDTLAVQISQELWERLPAAITAAVSKSVAGGASVAKSSLVVVKDRDGPTAKYAELELTDSRPAAYLHSVLTKHHFLSLQSGRVTKSGEVAAAGGSGTTAVKKSKKKKEIPDPEKMNLDTPDYEAIVERINDCKDDDGGVLMCPELLLLRKVIAAAAAGDDGRADPPPFTLDDIIRFVEKKVKYAGWLDPDGAPSPFAIAAFMHKHVGTASVPKLTGAMLRKHIAAGCRGKAYARLAAAVFARFVLPAEEFPSMIAPLLDDRTIVAVTEDDLREPISVAEYVDELVEKVDPFEAFVPVYHSVDRVKAVIASIRVANAAVAPSSAQQQQEQQLHEEQADRQRQEVAAAAAAKKSTLMGFRSLREYMAHVEEQRRLNENRAQLSAIIGAAAGAAGGYDNDDVDEDGNVLTDLAALGFAVDDDDDDDRGTSNAAASRRLGDDAAGLPAKRVRRDEGAGSRQQRRRNTDGGITLDEARFLHANQQKLLAMAGRTRPFKRNDPHYFEF